MFSRLGLGNSTRHDLILSHYDAKPAHRDTSQALDSSSLLKRYLLLNLSTEETRDKLKWFLGVIFLFVFKIA
jgi:hypothetical protein